VANNSRLSITVDAPRVETGGCSFCTDRPEHVTVVEGAHPSRHVSVRFCGACLAELRDLLVSGSSNERLLQARGFIVDYVGMMEGTLAMNVIAAEDPIVKAVRARLEQCRAWLAVADHETNPEPTNTITVRCKCGWIGVTGLLSYSPHLDKYSCPVCRAPFLPVPALKADAEPEQCEHLRSELLAEKRADGEPLFEMRKCIDCTKIFRVRRSLKTNPEPT
jgi:hypothetical protein